MDCFASVNVRPHKGRITEPHRCTNCKQPFTYMLQHNLSEFENKQIIKLQEAPEVSVHHHLLSLARFCITEEGIRRRLVVY